MKKKLITGLDSNRNYPHIGGVLSHHQRYP